MKSENTAFKKFMKVVDKTEDICLVVMFALMVIFIFLQIIMRFIVGHSLVWSEELGKFIFVWLSWLGISIGERRNEHIKITLLTDRLSPKWQKIFEIVAYLVLLVILAVIIYYAVILVEFQWKVSMPESRSALHGDIFPWCSAADLWYLEYSRSYTETSRLLLQRITTLRLILIPFHR